MPCPPFLSFNKTSGVCECVTVLKEYCNASTNHNGLVRRPAASYIGYIKNCTNVYHYCPIDRCGSSALYINASEQDNQCLHNRKGIMCAECKDGFSKMIGSMERYCGQNYPFVITHFIINRSFITTDLLI